MKKIAFLLLLVVSITSCSSQKIARQFGIDFQNAVLSGDKETIVKLYPGSIYADSLSFVFLDDSLKTKTKKDTIIAKYGNNVEVRLLKKDDGLVVLSSKGLFVFPEEKKAIAELLGQFEESLSDCDNALRMSDEGYDIYLKESFFPEQVHPLAIGDYRVERIPGYMYDRGYGFRTVINKSSLPVAGSDYVLAFNSGYIGFGRMAESPSWFEGKDIPPKGSVEFEESFTGHDYIDNEHIEYKISEVELLKKFYSATGNEYAEFINVYGSLSDKTFPDAPIGTKSISGKVGRYSIKGEMIFDGNHFTGEYGYNKRTKGLLIEGHLRTDGRFSCIEREANGKISGFYQGKYTSDGLEGTFTNSSKARYPAEIRF